jgi:hypothetical protein
MIGLPVEWIGPRSKTQSCKSPVIAESLYASEKKYQCQADCSGSKHEAARRGLHFDVFDSLSLEDWPGLDYAQKLLPLRCHGKTVTAPQKPLQPF